LQRFGKDIVVDLICFRKYGHNELDDPTFTNPIMYKRIAERNERSVPIIYEEKLVNEDKLVSKKRVDEKAQLFQDSLQEALLQVTQSAYKIESRNTYLNKQWVNMRIAPNDQCTSWSTGCDMDFLKNVGLNSVSYPHDFVRVPSHFRTLPQNSKQHAFH
jgi:probable 2-oxoglutarate dehydrogenase E1 component DHKTD1